MICPRCKNNMEEISLNNAKLDICKSCEGLWFDKNELQTIISMPENEIKSSIISSSWETDTIRNEKPSDGELLCPRCDTILSRYYYSMLPDIVIDGCEDGCGIFTDDGEIKKIWDFLQESLKPISPEMKEKVDILLKQVKDECKQKEEVLIDSLVKMDDSPGIMKYPGMVLQFIYRMLYKAGI